jgi:hypothetical protein
VLEDFLKYKIEAKEFLLRKLSYLKDIPDRLYVLLKDSFPNYGLTLKKVRPFSLATFREKSRDPIPMDINHKRHRLKK